MGIELILNSANINFIAFSRFGGMHLDGQMFAIFVIILPQPKLPLPLQLFSIFTSASTP